MRANRLALLLAYQGERFHGFARQPGQATVEQALHETLAELLGRAPRALLPAGRTDAGVHAVGQVVSCHLEEIPELASLPAVLNARLPTGIWVRGAAQVGPRFHARAQAKSRCYRYLIECQDLGLEPAGRAWRIDEKIDLEQLQRACERLRGVHELGSFAHRLDPTRSDRCEILRLQAQRSGPLLIIELEASRFLRRMARILVGTLIEIAQGTRDLDQLEAALAGRTRDLAGPSAPARGLYLMRVNYDPEDLRGPEERAVSRRSSQSGSASSAATLASICA